MGKDMEEERTRTEIVPQSFTHICIIYLSLLSVLVIKLIISRKAVRIFVESSLSLNKQLPKFATSVKILSHSYLICSNRWMGRPSVIGHQGLIQPYFLSRAALSPGGTFKEMNRK